MNPTSNDFNFHDQIRISNHGLSKEIFNSPNQTPQMPGPVEKSMAGFMAAKADGRMTKDTKA